MAPILVLAFENTDTSGARVWTYRAYSSNDPQRSMAKLKRDVFIAIGYQECNHEDNMTAFGRLEHYVLEDCSADLGARSQGVYFVVRSDHDIDTNYSVVARDNRARLVDEGAEEDRIMEGDHFVATEVDMPGYDTDSSGSDSDSD
jgi:hypothetical protein